ncbi:MAG: flagellum-specific ATP synthase FliI, partial [Gammaproteobacteria bacterium]|nr:flagellum-specific ATP synthase FliI [Gammaproteobacteria bacterium]
MPQSTLAQRLSQQQQFIKPNRPVVAGRLIRVVGLTLEATGCSAAIGQTCVVETANGLLEAEVVGFAKDRIFLMPKDDVTGVVPGARVTPLQDHRGVPLSMALLGRVIDGAGKPLDGKGPVLANEYSKGKKPPIN